MFEEGCILSGLYNVLKSNSEYRKFTAVKNNKLGINDKKWNVVLYRLVHTINISLYVYINGSET